jgi:serine/threonine protein kinase
MQQVEKDIERLESEHQSKAISKRFEQLRIDDLDNELFEQRMESLLSSHTKRERPQNDLLRSKWERRSSLHSAAKLEKPEPMWHLKDLSSVQRIRQIAEGSSSVFWEARIGNSRLCAKQILQPTSKSRNVCCKSVQLMRKHPHQHLVKHFGVGSDEVTGEFFIFRELLDFSLAQLRKGNRPMSEAAASVVICQLLKALSHLHAAGIVHAGIEPSQILISTKGIVKLSGFLADPTLQTPSVYSAPEARSGLCLEVSDSWSVGSLLFEMVVGHSPIPEPDTLHPLIPGNISSLCGHFLEKCWTQDALKRPSAEQLVSDPFLAQSHGHGALVGFMRRQMNQKETSDSHLRHQLHRSPDSTRESGPCHPQKRHRSVEPPFEG